MHAHGSFYLQHPWRHLRCGRATAGRGLLMGGRGADRLVGAAGNDILVAGELDCSTTREITDDLLDIASAPRPDVIKVVNGPRQKLF